MSQMPSIVVKKCHLQSNILADNRRAEYNTSRKVARVTFSEQNYVRRDAVR